MNNENEEKFWKTIKYFNEEFEKWRKTLTPSQEREILKKASDLHIRISDYPKMALRLYFVQNVMNLSKKRFVGWVLAKYFNQIHTMDFNHFKYVVEPPHVDFGERQEICMNCDKVTVHVQLDEDEVEDEILEGLEGGDQVVFRCTKCGEITTAKPIRR